MSESKLVETIIFECRYRCTWISWLHNNHIIWKNETNLER